MNAAQGRPIMRPTFFFSLSTLTLGFFATLAFERDADACTPPLHQETRVAPRDGQSLPASAPGIVVSGEVGIQVELVAAGGASITGSLVTTPAGRYFAPSSPLAVGAYTFRYQSWAPGTGSTPPTMEQALTVTDAVPLPTATGTLSVKSAERKSAPVTTSSGSCVETADIAIVHLALAADASLAPYGDAAMWKTTVDGNDWSGAQGTLPNGSFARSVVDLFTACGSPKPFIDTGLKAGVHDVELTPVIVGSTAPITAAKLRVTVSCDADNGKVEPATVVPPTNPPGTGNEVTPPTGSSGGGGTSTSDPSATTPAGSAEASDSGCAAAPSGERSFGLASLVGLVALVTAAARRRARRG